MTHLNCPILRTFDLIVWINSSVCSKLCSIGSNASKSLSCSWRTVIYNPWNRYCKYSGMLKYWKSILNRPLNGAVRWDAATYMMVESSTSMNRLITAPRISLVGTRFGSLLIFVLMWQARNENLFVSDLDRECSEYFSENGDLWIIGIPLQIFRLLQNALDFLLVLDNLALFLEIFGNATGAVGVSENTLGDQKFGGKHGIVVHSCSTISQVKLLSLFVTKGT